MLQIEWIGIARDDVQPERATSQRGERPDAQGANAADDDPGEYRHAPLAQDEPQHARRDRVERRLLREQRYRERQARQHHSRERRTFGTHFRLRGGWR